MPNNLNISFDGVESDVLVRRLDERDIAVSSGSACSNSTWEPSHVLMAMGVPYPASGGQHPVFSLGEKTSEAEIEAVLAVPAGGGAGFQRRNRALPVSIPTSESTRLGEALIILRPPSTEGMPHASRDDVLNHAVKLFPRQESHLSMVTSSTPMARRATGFTGSRRVC